MGFGDETGGCRHPSPAAGRSWQARPAWPWVLLCWQTTCQRVPLAPLLPPCLAQGSPSSPCLPTASSHLRSTTLLGQRRALDNNIFLMCLKQPKSQAFPGIAFQRDPHPLTKGQSKAVLFLQTQTPTEIPAFSGCWRWGQAGWCHSCMAPTSPSSAHRDVTSQFAWDGSPVSRLGSSISPSTVLPRAAPARRLRLLAAGPCLLCHLPLCTAVFLSFSPTVASWVIPSACKGQGPNPCLVSPV